MEMLKLILFYVPPSAVSKIKKKKRTPEDFNALMTSKVIYKIQCKRIGYP
jgi:hypothetical protein